MNNCGEIIMSHNNKKLIMCGLNEGEYSDKKEIMNEIAARIISVPDDCEAFMNEIAKHPDTTALIDMLVGDRDAVSFMRETKRIHSNCHPAFIVMCEYVSFRMERELYNAGASYVLAKNALPGAIRSIMRECFGIGSAAPDRLRNPKRHTDFDTSELEIMVTDIMHKVGVPAHIKGYQYLRCAIVKTVVSPELINAVTKELYPGVAECFCTTPSRVERAIRHAIEVAWDRGDIDFLSAYFGSTVQNTRGKPTNSEFIAIIADKMRMTIRSA